MNKITPFRDADLVLIRQTVAKDCSPNEFDMFIHIARAVGLDPLRRQIYAFVFGKKGPDRQLTVVTGIDGYRTISERSGNYRPDNRTPRYTYNDDLRSSANPLGIVSCEVSIFKFSHGEWHEVPGLAFWDECCPITYREEDLIHVETGKTYRDSGKPIIKKMPREGAKPIVDPAKQGWIKMARNQIAKCAEAIAHRKAFPNDFAGVFVEEEVQRQMSSENLTASEIADAVESDARLVRIGGPNQIIVDWLNGEALKAIPANDFFGHAMDFLKAHKGDPATIAVWRDRNRDALRVFWGLKRAEALQLNIEIEEIERS